mmetsp:Transcript_54038/g.115394  ORF Transcript_54038/g.115394 Transcript_54038/m.115394 type:complete len:291 (-) Transcript_54038:661-1533(-)
MSLSAQALAAASPGLSSFCGFESSALPSSISLPAPLGLLLQSASRLAPMAPAARERRCWLEMAPVASEASRAMQMDSWRCNFFAMGSCMRSLRFMSSSLVASAQAMSCRKGGWVLSGVLRITEGMSTNLGNLFLTHSRSFALIVAGGCALHPPCPSRQRKRRSASEALKPIGLQHRRNSVASIKFGRLSFTKAFCAIVVKSTSPSAFSGSPVRATTRPRNLTKRKTASSSKSKMQMRPLRVESSSCQNSTVRARWLWWPQTSRKVLKAMCTWLVPGEPLKSCLQATMLEL